MPKHIMDVSRWQGSIDWDAVKASGLFSGVMLRTRQTLMKSRSKEDIMASTTYRHLGNVTVMVRNAGQLPQPFWIGAHGGGSRGAARFAART